MPDILHEVTIEASPDQIFKALTEQDQIARWWSQYVSAEPRVGSKTEIKFYGGQVRFVFSVDTLDPDSAVHWSVVSAVPGWENTIVTWDFSPAEAGTKLLLGHRNWASTDGLYASVSYNWAWYLTSLKDYLETGVGRPHVDPA